MAGKGRKSPRGVRGRAWGFGAQDAVLHSYHYQLSHGSGNSTASNLVLVYVYGMFGMVFMVLIAWFLVLEVELRHGMDGYGDSAGVAASRSKVLGYSP